MKGTLYVHENLGFIDLDKSNVAKRLLDLLEIPVHVEYVNPPPCKETKPFLVIDMEEIFPGVWRKKVLTI